MHLSLIHISLKLYLFSFRNHGDFHEDCVNIIMKDLIRLMDPKYICLLYTSCAAEEHSERA